MSEVSRRDDEIYADHIAGFTNKEIATRNNVDANEVGQSSTASAPRWPTRSPVLIGHSSSRWKPNASTRSRRGTGGRP